MPDTWRDRLREDPVAWLLASNSWTRHKTLTDLLDYEPNPQQQSRAKEEVRESPEIEQLIRETADWLPKAAGRNSDPRLSYFKLRMLADFGLTKDDTGIKTIIDKAASHTSEGMFTVRGQHPQRRKKGEQSGERERTAEAWHAAPCNSPVLLYSLLALGIDTEQTREALRLLQEYWSTPQGWFCHYFFVDSMFRKLQAGCPMAGLMALDVFSLVPELKEADCARNAYEPLRYHREFGKTMYYFGRSKRFWTLKYPFVWYNALYLAEVLTRFDFLLDEPLVQELVNWIEGSQDEMGRFTPSSMFMAYKGWDFANKKEPSPWITFLCCRILKRRYG